MNPDSGISRPDYYKHLITILFVVLIFFSVILTAVFWTLMLEPQLAARARITARSVMVSQMGPLKQHLDSFSGDLESLKKDILGKILILTDPESKVPFITGIRLALDHDVMGLPQAGSEIILGEWNEEKGIVKERVMDIPVYSDKSRELQGILHFSVNPMFIRHFVKRIKLTFFSGAGIGMLLLLVAWGVTALVLARLKTAEKTIEEKKAQLIHAGRLTALGEMATGIAHELNQPLAIIRIASDGLCSWFSEKGESCDMERKASETVSKQVDRARNIIDHMRSFARMDNHDNRIVPLSEPVYNAVSFFREQFRNHGILLSSDLSEDIRIWTNPWKFEQIIVNLLSNARFAVDNRDSPLENGHEKTIHIRSFRDFDNKRIVLEVRDNGKGMGPDEIERCLEPFFTTKKVGEGTGLGLSIVHSIARESGMSLEIESIKGIGSTFRLLIPNCKYDDTPSLICEDNLMAS